MRRATTRVFWWISLSIALAACSGTPTPVQYDDERAASTELVDFDELWDYGDPAATEVAFREVLDSLSPDVDANYRAELVTQIARTHSLRSQFDEAHAVLDQLPAQMPPESVSQVRYLLERGRTFNSAGNKEAARTQFLLATDLAREIGADYYHVDALHMLGIVDEGEAGIEWNRQAIELAQASEDERAHRWQGALLNNTGWTLFDMGEAEQALDYFERALVFRQEQGLQDTIWIARWCVARAYRELGRVEEALAEFEAILAEQRAADSANDGYVFEEIGECLLLVERESEAPPFFAQAYELLSDDAWFAENEPVRLERLRTLGQQN